LSETLQLLLIVVLGGLVHGVTGFGFGLFTMGVLSVLMPMGDAVTIVSLINLVITLLNLWTLQGSNDWRESWPVLGAAIPTTVLGVYLLRSLDTGLLRTGVGLMILMGCAVALWSPQRARLRGASPWGYVAGLVGGVFGGALNTGGPPVVLYTSSPPCPRYYTLGEPCPPSARPAWERPSRRRYTPPPPRPRSRPPAANACAASAHPASVPGR